MGDKDLGQPQPPASFGDLEREARALLEGLEPARRSGPHMQGKTSRTVFLAAACEHVDVKIRCVRVPVCRPVHEEVPSQRAQPSPPP